MSYNVNFFKGHRVRNTQNVEQIYGLWLLWFLIYKFSLLNLVPRISLLPLPWSRRGTGRKETLVVNYLPQLDQKRPRPFSSPRDFCSDCCGCSYLLEPPKRTLQLVCQNRIPQTDLKTVLCYLIL